MADQPTPPDTPVKSQHIQHVESKISTAQRTLRNGHEGGVLWFTGLSAAGKSTLALNVERELFDRGYHVYVLDGDNVRAGVNADLGFSPEDRTENIRRIGEIAALFADAGTLVISAFISPYRKDRDKAREAAPGRFCEIYVKADLAVCEARDPKGLYKKARRGEIEEFTGVSAPYEPPEQPELVVETDKHSVAECVREVVDYVEARFGAAAGVAESTPRAHTA